MNWYCNIETPGQEWGTCVSIFTYLYTALLFAAQIQNISVEITFLCLTESHLFICF